MKILHINSYYSGSKFYKNLYDYQVNNGLEISVFVPVSASNNNNNEDLGPYTTISKNHTKFDRFVFHLKQNKIYKDIMSKYDIKEYSVIHAHSLFSNGYIAMKLKEEFGIPYIVAVRNTDVNIFFKKMIHLRKMGVRILENANQIIFLSDPYRDEVIQKYIPENLKQFIFKKTVVIPNGINDFWFENIGSPKQVHHEYDLRLLQIGDINKNKNIVTTIKAIDILVDKGFNVKLDVVGKIKDQHIFNKIKELDFVNYLGFKSKEELIKIYRENDIFVLPSINETFGLVYAEAMSQGLPIIYTRGQGFDGQFVENEIGYSVESNNYAEISSKVEEIMKEFEKLSKNCIDRVGKFKWENISSMYSDIYKKV